MESKSGREVPEKGKLESTEVLGKSMTNFACCPNNVLFVNQNSFITKRLFHSYQITIYFKVVKKHLKFVKKH